MMRSFNRCYVGLLGVCVLSAGCINVGSRFDMRRYPTPIANPSQKAGVQHIWCPDEPAATFTGPATQFQQNQGPTVPKPMPVGPAAQTSGKVSLGDPLWNDPAYSPTVLNGPQR